MSLSLVKRSGSKGKQQQVKAYIECGGDVHTVRVNAGGCSGVEGLREALRTACIQSAAPELRRLDLSTAELQYLDGEGGPPALVTEATSAKAIRSAKAFRVVFPS